MIFDLISESDSIILAAMTAHSILPKTKRRSVGRPRRLTLDAVLDAACEIDHAELDMAALAQRLGVGVATLYGYVQGRDHLLRLVAIRRNRLGFIADKGQPWQDVLREHADTAFKVWVAWPQLIHQIMDGAVFGMLEMDYLESLLALLVARGLTPEDALALYYEVNQLVFGAAVAASHLRAVELTEGGFAAAQRSVLATRATDELPTLRRASHNAAPPPCLGNYRPALERLLLDYR